MQMPTNTKKLKKIYQFIIKQILFTLILLFFLLFLLITYELYFESEINLKSHVEIQSSTPEAKAEPNLIIQGPKKETEQLDWEKRNSALKKPLDLEKEKSPERKMIELEIRRMIRRCGGCFE